MAKKKVIKDVEAEETKDNLPKEVEIETKEELKSEETKKDKKVKDKKEKSPKDKKEGYLKLVARELKKVVWPKSDAIIKYSFAVIVFCLVLCLFFIGIDLIASLIKGLFV